MASSRVIHDVCSAPFPLEAQNLQNENTGKKLEEGEARAEDLKRMQEGGMRKHAKLEEKEEGNKEENVVMGKREGQTSETMGFREAQKDVRDKKVQELLSTDEVARQINKETRGPL